MISQEEYINKEKEKLSKKSNGAPTVLVKYENGFILMTEDAFNKLPSRQKSLFINASKKVKK